MAGNNLITVFLARESSVSDIAGGDGKIANLFLQCTVTGENTFLKVLLSRCSDGSHMMECIAQGKVVLASVIVAGTKLGTFINM